MDEKYSVSTRLKYVAALLVFIGIVTLSFGFYFESEKHGQIYC